MPIFNIILIVTILLAIYVHMTGKSSDKDGETSLQKFWKREYASNTTRKKDISGLGYLKVNLDALPFDYNSSNADIVSKQNLIKELSGKPMINLSSYTNTELKLKFGTANISALTEYDNDYASFITALDQWAVMLAGNDKDDSAVRVLEYAVECGSDITNTYRLLASLYAKSHNMSSLESLHAKAEMLTGITKPAIMKAIDDADPDNTSSILDKAIQNAESFSK